MFPILYIFSDWGLLALRLILGALFVVHGLPKIKNIKQTAENFQGMGFRPGMFWGPVVAAVEFFGGIALIFGFSVQIVAGLFTIQFATITVWKLIKRAPFIGGLELDLLLLGTCLMLVTIGGGIFSLDRFLAFGNL